MSDFSDRPFVAGSLVGLRAFRLDKFGRLLGPSVPQVFKPGENDATCRKDDVPSMYSTIYGGIFATAFAPPPQISFPTLSYTTKVKSAAEVSATASPSVAVEAVEASKVCEHTVGGLGCSCGFYAYFDGRNDYKQAENIAAIIEGYGVCTFGDRGFRASKARLVALIEPKAKVSPMLRDYLHRNYAEVPFYATRREALTAHPLTPSPTTTPDDPDFWTREVPR